jgi:N-acetylneuraminate synthase/N,N'-diacetyllegionaminate synthase
VDFLDRLGVPAFKIASGEITNYPLLAHIAGKKKPVLLSTGMSSLEEVERAVTTLNNEGCNQLILLHCLSCYPADITEVNLRAILTLITEFGLPVGFSDHTLGIEIALAAIALGACVIEKHFTLDRGSPGPDHAASLLPVELRELVQGIRKVEASLGDGVKIPQPSEANSRLAARRSIVAERDIPPGELITENMLALRRPGTGIHPKEINQVIGKRAAQSIPLGTVIQWDMLT